MHFGDKKSKVVTPRTDASEKLFGLVTTVIGGKGTCGSSFQTHAIRRKFEKRRFLRRWQQVAESTLRRGNANTRRT